MPKVKLYVEHNDGQKRIIPLDGANLLWSLHWRQGGVEVLCESADGPGCLCHKVLGEVRYAYIFREGDTDEDD